MLLMALRHCYSRSVTTDFTTWPTEDVIISRPIWSEPGAEFQFQAAPLVISKRKKSKGFWSKTLKVKDFLAENLFVIKIILRND